VRRERWALVAIGVVGAVLAAAVVLFVRAPATPSAVGPTPTSTVDIVVAHDVTNPPAPAASIGPSIGPSTGPTKGLPTTGPAPATSDPTTASIPPTTPTSSGPVVVPDVMYLKEQTARTLLTSAGLVPDITYLNNGAYCGVVGQDPPGDTTVPAGTVVHLTAVRPSSSCVYA